MGSSLEVALLAMVGSGKHTPGECAQKLGIPPKPARYIFQLWSERGWYEWQGNRVDEGWLTPNGQDALAGFAERAA
jgi:hypothetical protein